MQLSYNASSLLTETFLITTTLTHSHIARRNQELLAGNTCVVTSFDSQGQLCLLTCAGWRCVSNHTRMSTIQSRRQKKKAKKKKHGNLAWKFPWKSCSTTHLTLFSTNPGKILKPFPKSFPTEMEPTNAQQKTKQNNGRKSERKKSRLLCHF